MKARLSEIDALLPLNFIELAVFPSDVQFLDGAQNLKDCEDMVDNLAQH